MDKILTRAALSSVFVNNKAFTIMKMVISLLVIISVLGACSSNFRLKKEVFDKVEIGMTKGEVKTILGEPYDIRFMVSSDSLYKFIKEKSLFALKFADVHFDNSERVSFLSYGVPGY